MAHDDGGEPKTARTGSSRRPFPLRRAFLTAAAGAIACAGAIFSIWQQNSRGRSSFRGIGITVYAAVVMGIVGLLCAAIFRATWSFRWGAGARGIFMMAVGAAAGVLGGLYIGTGVFGELDSSFARPAVAVYALIFSTIAWTIGGAASPWPRSPGAATTRSGPVPARIPTLTAWQWRALIAIFIAVSALGVILWIGELLPPPRPQPAGPTLATWGPPLSPLQKLMTHVGFMAVIGLALAATVLGGHGVARRFRRGDAGPGTAIIVLALLPVALIGVGGYVLALIFLVRSILR